MLTYKARACSSSEWQRELELELETPVCGGSEAASKTPRRPSLARAVLRAHWRRVAANSLVAVFSVSGADIRAGKS